MLETRLRRPRRKNLERVNDLFSAKSEQVLAYMDMLICLDLWFSIYRDAVRILMFGDKKLRTFSELLWGL